MPAGWWVGHILSWIGLARMNRHLHDGIHWGCAGDHASRARHRVHPRHYGSHIVLLLFYPVLLYQLSMLLLLLADLKQNIFRIIVIEFLYEITKEITLITFKAFYHLKS